MRLPWFVKQHTECFTCSRFYFNELVQRCPCCGSESIQHYSTDDLGLLSRFGDRGSYPEPAKPTFVQYAE